MNIFDPFAKKNAPYWQFDPAHHFRPRLYRDEFYHLSGFEFGWFVLEPMSTFVQSREYELARTRRLSYGQKALYFWWYLDGQVTNGGFVQFYYNGYAPYVGAILKGLRHVGDDDMAALVEKADRIFQKNKNLVKKARQQDLFGSDLYDRLYELSELDEPYYEMNERTMARIEAYARRHPNEFGADENGRDFDPGFSGECTTYYPNGQTRAFFHLKNGRIDGVFRSYFENGDPLPERPYSIREEI